MKNSLLALVLTILPFSSLASITITFSHVVAPTTPKGQMAEKFKELVEARSNGEIKVEVFPNSQLYNDSKVLEALFLGDVQMAAPALSKFTRLTKKLQIFDLPFLFQDMQAVNRFEQSPAGQKLLGSMQNKGIIGLGYIHNGLKQFTANSPIRVPADMKKKKFRIMSSDVLAAQMHAVDAIAVKKPFSEVFTLLQTRSIDGQESPYSNIYSQKFFEVQPYITHSNHGLLEYMLITSKKFMDSLTPRQQKLVKEAAAEASAYGNELAKKINEESRQKIAASGYSEIIELTPEQRKQWIEVMRPVWKTFEGEIGKDLIEAAERANTPIT